MAKLNNSTFDMSTDPVLMFRKIMVSRYGTETEQCSLPAHRTKEKEMVGQWFGQFLQEAAAKFPYRNGQMSDLLINGNNTETSKKETSE